MSRRKAVAASSIHEMITYSHCNLLRLFPASLLSPHFELYFELRLYACLLIFAVLIITVHLLRKIACVYQFSLKVRVGKRNLTLKRPATIRLEGGIGEPSDGRECKIGFKDLETASLQGPQGAKFQVTRLRPSAPLSFRSSEPRT